MTKGGTRPGAGRPAYPQELKRITVTLTQAQIEYLKQTGGNVSEGIRQLIESSPSK